VANDTSWELWCKIQKLSKSARRIVIQLIDFLLSKEGKSQS